MATRRFHRRSRFHFPRSRLNLFRFGWYSLGVMLAMAAGGATWFATAPFVTATGIALAAATIAANAAQTVEPARAGILRTNIHPIMARIAAVRRIVHPFIEVEFAAGAAAGERSPQRTQRMRTTTATVATPAASRRAAAAIVTIPCATIAIGAIFCRAATATAVGPATATFVEASRQASAVAVALVIAIEAVAAGQWCNQRERGQNGPQQAINHRCSPWDFQMQKSAENRGYRQ